MVSIFPRASRGCGRFAASSRTQGLQDELDEICPSFSFGGQSVDGIGFPQAVLPG